MRKTRLVILPTKCLHQMGFLLLFLSCPVIGDWGRIRPESEDSHNAIQIDREGTCGYERDPPGGLVDFLKENGSKQCRLSEDLNSNIPPKSVERVIQTTKSDERRADVRRVNHPGKERMLERRINNERSSRKMIKRKMSDERRNARRVVQRNATNDVRSRSVESRRSSSNRNDVRTRSLSLSRVESDRAVRIIQRQNNERNLRRDSERLHLVRRRSERQNEQKTEQQRRFTRELSNERRENERTIRTASERRERETGGTARLIRLAERERQDVRRESNRRSIQLQPMRRNDVARRQIQESERIQNIRRRTERRLSLAQRGQSDATRVERFENRRISEKINLERRVPEIRKSRSLESEGRKSDQREKLVRMTRSFENHREIDNKRFANLPPKPSEETVRERRGDLGMNEKLEGMKSRKITSATMRRNQNDIPQVNLYLKKVDEENFFGGITKWIDLKSYESYKTGDWTTNCVIGAVVYYLTTRQVKAV